MKTNILLTLLSVSVVVQAQTSLEEYNYMVKGYKIQIESGLDMKKGYEFRTDTSTEIAELNKMGLEFKDLYFVAKNSYRGTLLIAKIGEIKWYICIPAKNSDDEVWNKYFEQLQTFFDAYRVTGYSDSSKDEIVLLTYVISDYLAKK